MSISDLVKLLKYKCVYVGRIACNSFEVIVGSRNSRVHLLLVGSIGSAIIFRLF